MSSSLLLTGGVDAAGAPVAVRADKENGLIAEVAPSLDAYEGEQVVACDGLVVLPAPAEPHAHLDKALTAARCPNPAGDLEGAIVAWRAQRGDLTASDIAARARAQVEENVAKGITAIRTHVDVGTDLGVLGIETVAELRTELRGLCDIEIVALISCPVSGPEGAPQRALLAQALEAGADVVGGAPHIDPDPIEATRILVDVAAAESLPIDLHTDETLDPATLSIGAFAAMVAEAGLQGRAVASHAVSLGVQPPDIQAYVSGTIADAGLAVVSLPQTNLYLQARGLGVAPPRGLTAIAALRRAGVLVAAGADNLRDPFCVLGRGDATETAALLVMAAHLDPETAWAFVSTQARAAIGLPENPVAPGAPAELLAIAGTDLTDALARASETRVVVHRGHVVARTETSSSLSPLPTDPLLT